MKHLEKPLHTDEKPVKKITQNSKVSKLKLFLAGALLIAGLGSGMNAIWNSSVIDNISDSKKSELVSEFSKIKSITVEPVAAQDIELALNSMNLPHDHRQNLKSVLSTSNDLSKQTQASSKPDYVGLVWVTLWDFASPDGDIVHISSGGYEMDIPIQKLQIRIAIPLEATKTVKISGVHDGGGGITLGIQSGVSPVSLPVLGVGQQLVIPISF